MKKHQTGNKAEQSLIRPCTCALVSVCEECYLIKLLIEFPLHHLRDDKGLGRVLQIATTVTVFYCLNKKSQMY
jgi:hypothetical protein